MLKRWIWIVLVVSILGLGFFFLQQRDSRQSAGVHDELNSDGIRADVAAEIAKAFPDSERKRAAATQLAKTFQMSLEQPDHAMDVNASYEQAKACLNAIEGVSPGAEPSMTSHMIESWVVNSTARSRAYIHYNAGLSGQIFKVIGADVSACDFDPSKMRD